MICVRFNLNVKNKLQSLYGFKCTNLLFADKQLDET